MSTTHEITGDNAKILERQFRRFGSARVETPRRGILIGKGPSFENLNRQSLDLSQYLVLGLNHVVQKVPVDVMNAIDMDVVVDCSQAIESNVGILAVPYHPHVAFEATERTIFDFFEEVPILRKMSDAQRLFIYNASSGNHLSQLEGAPVVEAVFFSSEAGYELLRMFGATEIQTIGIDGGARYAKSFGSFSPLMNGRSTFGHQFLSLNRKFQTSGVPFGPLEVDAPIRIFVGCDQTQYLASRVLEYSILLHCDTAVDIQRIDNTGISPPKDPEKRARTPFSFARFKIPELCGFKGRAIYLDADMIVFDNIREVWEFPFDDYALLYSSWGSDRNPQYSVMLLNCEELQWDPKKLVQLLNEDGCSYDDLMYHFKFMDRKLLGPVIPETWNSLEVYEDGQTKLLHYTDMNRQPWVANVNENASLFYSYLQAAMADGFISKGEFVQEVRKGFVSPCLADWIGVERPADAPDERSWVAPYQRAALGSKTDLGTKATRKLVKRVKKLWKRPSRTAS